MSDVLKETFKIGEGQNQGGGVVVGVEGDFLRLLQIPIDEDPDMASGIVEQSEGRNRPRT